MFIIEKDDNFLKIAKKFFKKHPDLIDNFKDLIIKVHKNPFQSSLKLHKLKGRLKNYHSISLNYKYRVILILKIIDNKIILVDIGSHDEVY